MKTKTESHKIRSIIIAVSLVSVIMFVVAIISINSAK